MQEEIAREDLAWEARKEAIARGEPVAPIDISKLDFGSMTKIRVSSAWHGAKAKAKAAAGVAAKEAAAKAAAMAAAKVAAAANSNGSNVDEKEKS